jgi:hypothetical protein
VAKAEQLPDLLLAQVGPQRPDRSMLDELDTRALQSYYDRSGHVIDDPSEAGSWPDLPVVRAAKDTDGDGMSDEWERHHAGLNPNDKSDCWGDRNGDGQTNLEEYLSALAGDSAGPE